jgi:uncharacterized membrane protein
LFELILWVQAAEWAVMLRLVQNQKMKKPEEILYEHNAENINYDDEDAQYKFRRDEIKCKKCWIRCTFVFILLVVSLCIYRNFQIYDGSFNDIPELIKDKIDKTDLLISITGYMLLFYYWCRIFNEMRKSHRYEYERNFFYMLT